jgi:hypothetical protein
MQKLMRAKDPVLPMFLEVSQAEEALEKSS